jgi:hypothetical protein
MLETELMLSSTPQSVIQMDGIDDKTSGRPREIRRVEKPSFRVARASVASTKNASPLGFEVETGLRIQPLDPKERKESPDVDFGDPRVALLYKG